MTINIGLLVCLFLRENEVFSPMRAGDFIEHTLDMFGNNNQIIVDPKVRRMTVLLHRLIFVIHWAISAVFSRLGLITHPINYGVYTLGNV